MNESQCEMKLPGFRFHPTEEELLNFYLKSIVFGNKFRDDVIGFLNIYDYDPRDLPRLAKIGEREWYFFVPRDRKHGSGGRPNRTTETGFWKATGSDRQILSLSDPRKMLGLKKTLVFYQGRAPRGKKTEWIMNEYRLPDKCSAPKDIVLCKVYMKATSLKVLEQRAAMEEGVVRTYGCSSSSSLLSPVRPPNTAALASFFGLQFEEDCVGDMSMQLKKEEEEMVMTTGEINKGRPCSSLLLPNGLQNMAELQVPKMTVDWTQDSFLTQLSPWLDNFTPFVPLC